MVIKAVSQSRLIFYVICEEKYDGERKKNPSDKACSVALRFLFREIFLSKFFTFDIA